MASFKKIFELIVVIKLFATSPVTCIEGINQIYPEGTIRVLHGYGTFRAGRAGTDCPNEIDRFCYRFEVTKMSKLYRTRTHMETFETLHNEIISQVRVSEMEFRFDLGGRGGSIELVNGGPGFPSVTLKFTSDWDDGIRKYVDLYCRDPPHQA